MNLWVPLEMRVFMKKLMFWKNLGKKEIKAENMAKNVIKDPSLLLKSSMEYARVHTAVVDNPFKDFFLSRG
jgi:hypothetical protein